MGLKAFLSYCHVWLWVPSHVCAKLDFRTRIRVKRLVRPGRGMSPVGLRVPSDHPQPLSKLSITNAFAILTANSR